MIELYAYKGVITLYKNLQKAYINKFDVLMKTTR